MYKKVLYSAYATESWFARKNYTDVMVRCKQKEEQLIISRNWAERLALKF